ncbi:MAG: HlyD family type I secretion periplasmic adaptor subunit [Pseudomonadota bacterium]
MTAQLPDLHRGRSQAPSSQENMPDIFATRAPIAFGVIVLMIGLSLFAVWGLNAPLSSAAIAPGVLVVESKRQHVEHLEGGIVRAVHVQDGDDVRAGDLLMELESEASRSRFEQLNRRLISLLAGRDRLLAELEGAPSIEFDQRLVSLQPDENVREDMQLQRDLFRQRRENLQGASAVILEQIEQSRAQIEGFQARLEADEERFVLVGERLAGLESLAERGFASDIQLSEVRAQRANLRGSIGDMQARISEVNVRIAERNQELNNAETTFRQSVIEELQEVETELDEFDASLSAAADVVTRMEVRAPISDRIVGMAITSVGSVIEGGERLMEVVPQDDQLVIDALVKPEDIDQVYVGQPVDARLTAFNPRNTPPFPGQIVQISADRVVDERSGVAAYSATIELDLEGVEVPDTVALYPGMPAEVMIIMQERTFIDYLLGPLIRLFERGMRE